MKKMRAKFILSSVSFSERQCRHSCIDIDVSFIFYVNSNFFPVMRQHSYECSLVSLSQQGIFFLAVISTVVSLTQMSSTIFVGRIFDSGSKLASLQQEFCFVNLTLAASIYITYSLKT